MQRVRRAATLPVKTVIGVVCVALVSVLAGCGGESASDGASSGPSRAGDDAAVERLLEQTFGANPAASSGILSGTIEIDVTGVPRFSEPIRLSMSGPFSQAARDRSPEAKLSLGIELRDKAYGAELILAEDDVLIGLGSTSYEVPASIAARIHKPLSDADNALDAVLSVFAITPRRWAKDTRIVGDDRVAGVDVIHATAGIHAKPFFDDAAAFTTLLTRLRITEIAGIPRVIGPTLRAALVRSVTSATGDLYIGADDHVVRKARFEIALKPSAKDRRRLAGISSMKLVGNLDVTQVGSQQRISAPRARGSYSALQLTFDALEGSARKNAGNGN
jgi:hypothetical protein